MLFYVSAIGEARHGKKLQPRPRLAFNARVGEIGMVNPREVVGIYTQCAGKSGSATAATIQEDPHVGLEAFISSALLVFWPILRFVARVTAC